MSGTAFDAGPDRQPGGAADSDLLAAALLAALSKLARGVLIIDRRRQIRVANLAAVRILDSADALVAEDRRLRLLPECAQVAFERFLTLATCPSTAVTGAITFRLARTSGLPDYRAVVSPLNLVYDHVDDDDLFCLMIYEPQAVRFIPTQVLTELYGMTRAQARLVSQLFRGRSLSEAARLVGTTENTAKTQLKKVFIKCEVRSQAELLQLLALGPRSL